MIGNDSDDDKEVNSDDPILLLQQAAAAPLGPVVFIIVDENKPPYKCQSHPSIRDPRNAAAAVLLFVGGIYHIQIL